MCGIVGYVGNKFVDPILLVNLERLEYRGYDSAGIATISEGSLLTRKTGGKLRVLNDSLEKSPWAGPSASATPAGPRTASRTRPTPTRTSIATAGSPSSTTAS